MYKKLSLTTLVLLAFILLGHISPVKAQTPAGFTATCLSMDWCYEKENPNNSCVVKGPHRARLTLNTATGAPRPPVSPPGSTYIIECFNILENQEMDTICTTGDPNMDLAKDLKKPNTNISNFQRLSNINQYAVSRDNDPQYGRYKEDGRTPLNQNQITTTVDGMSPSAVEWGSYTNNSYPRSFLLVTVLRPQDTSSNITDSGLKQEILSFIGSCQTESWDPMGFAYDISTGDPIPDVNIDVSYSDKQSGPFSQATDGIGPTDVLPPSTLPIKTGTSGFYQFFGKPGWYKMLLGSNFTHISRDESTSISTGVKALYPENLNYYFTKDGEAYYEGRELKILHLPHRIDPAQVNPYQFKVLSASSEASGKTLVFKIQTSGPANVAISRCSTQNGVKNCSLYQSIDPTKGGPAPVNFFKSTFRLDQSILLPGEKFEVTATRYDAAAPQSKIQNSISKLSKALNQAVSNILTLIAAPTYAQESGVSFDLEPIPSYLEGYLYDETGKVLPNSDFGVYLSSMNQPLYSSKTDANGFFRVTSEYLPTSNFTISYIEESTSLRKDVSTSVFLSQNSEFMKSENVNPYLKTTVSSNPRRDITPSFTPRPVNQAQNVAISPTTTQTDNNNAQNQNSNPTNQGTNQQTVFAVVAFIILVLILTVTVIIYIRKKRSLNAEQPTL